MPTIAIFQPLRPLELKGKAKEKLGQATDDEHLEAEGRADQAKANLKQAGQKIKDAFRS